MHLLRAVKLDGSVISIIFLSFNDYESSCVLSEGHEYGFRFICLIDMRSAYKIVIYLYSLEFKWADQFAYSA